MGNRIQVNGQTSNWLTAGRFLAMLGNAIGLYQPFLLFVTVPLTFLTEGIAYQARARRWWIEIRDGEFSVIKRRGEFEYSDNDVVSMAYFVKKLFSNGVPHGWNRKATLWIENKVVPLRMDNSFKNDQADPVMEFLIRIEAMLLANAESLLNAGRQLEGKGWQLSRSEFLVQHGGRDNSVPISQITAVDVFDDKMCLWQKDQAEPFVRLPLDGRNIWLMRKILLGRIKSDDSSKPPTDGLGRVLFERKPSIVATVLWFFFAVLSFAACLFFMLAPIEQNGRQQQEIRQRQLLVPITLILAPVLLVAGLYSCVSVLRCQEWGVYQRTLFGRNQVLYTDVASFTYQAVRHYHNGAYTGTNISLRFDPFPDKGKRVSYSTSVKGEDSSLDHLRDFISSVICARMMREWSEGNEVAWTGTIKFLPDGVAYVPAGFFKKSSKGFVKLPFENCAGWNLDQGVFHLFEKGVKKSVFQRQVGTANFFPGFEMLHRITAAKPIPDQPENLPPSVINES